MTPFNHRTSSKIDKTNSSDPVGLKPVHTQRGQRARIEESSFFIRSARDAKIDQTAKRRRIARKDKNTICKIKRSELKGCQPGPIARPPLFVCRRAGSH
ncbi:hypothetical protein EVAR_76337_1 [Eumeta japonica]|uniref:Uncharacterized protein n=1 Tax=Eumeta variegata TaxID=151549 RepID=A0A4C1T8K8_EUMVA|nr:hypothetical protein EVAR_76337_1 [Eumeta japonica]